MNENNSRPIALIDGMNVFIRAFLGNQETNTLGEPFGGPIGVLRLVRTLIRDFSPESIYVIWEAGGASKRRSKILESYKDGSGRNAVNVGVFEPKDGFKKDLLGDEQLKARQLLFLNRILKQLKVQQIYIKDAEGDDVIQYCLEHFGKYTSYENALKIIASGDKDYYQFLLDDKVRLYQPIKRVLVNQEIAKEDTDGISVINYCVAKSFVGDKSDNIPGVPGIGYKTLLKFFPYLGEDKEILLNDLINDAKKLHYELSQEVNGKSKKIPVALQNIIDNIDIIKRNYKLIYIGNNALTQQQKESVIKQLEAEVPKQNLIEYLKIFSENKLNIMQEHESLFQETAIYLKK